MNTATERIPVTESEKTASNPKQCLLFGTDPEAGDKIGSGFSQTMSGTSKAATIERTNELFNGVVVGSAGGMADSTATGIVDGIGGIVDSYNNSINGNQPSPGYP